MKNSENTLNFIHLTLQELAAILYAPGDLNDEREELVSLLKELEEKVGEM